MFKPTGYRLLLKVPKAAKYSPGGIELIDKTRDNEQLEAEIGEVVAIGPTAFDTLGGPWCKVGDKILFAKYAGKFVPKTEREYLMINDEDVMGVEE